MKGKNNELRINAEELSSIKEQMKYDNNKAVIISNRMEDYIKLEDLNNAIRNKEVAYSILTMELEIVNELKGKINESKAISKRSNTENKKLFVLMTVLSNRFEKLQQYHKEKIFAFKKVMNNKDDEKKQISVLFEWN